MHQVSVIQGLHVGKEAEGGIEREISNSPNNFRLDVHFAISLHPQKQQTNNLQFEPKTHFVVIVLLETLTSRSKNAALMVLPGQVSKMTVIVRYSQLSVLKVRIRTSKKKRFSTRVRCKSTRAGSAQERNRGAFVYSLEQSLT